MNSDLTFGSTNDAYKTHLNYIRCMEGLTKDISIKVNLNLTGKLDNKNIVKFNKLARLTWTSIKGDVEGCVKEKAFSQIVAPWIPVKCYYYLYYLESMFIYLLKGSIVGFRSGGHKGIRSAISVAIQNKEILLTGFGAQDLSKITNWETANSFKTTGHTITPSYYTDPQCTDSIRGKLAEYIEHDWRDKNAIANYKSKISKIKRKDLLCPITFNLLDYFYWMRIKANYRDLDFLDFDNNISEIESFNYIMYYVKTVKNYSKALNDVVGQLSDVRGSTFEYIQ